MDRRTLVIKGWVNGEVGVFFGDWICLVDNKVSMQKFPPRLERLIFAHENVERILRKLLITYYLIRLSCFTRCRNRYVLILKRIEPFDNLQDRTILYSNNCHINNFWKEETQETSSFQFQKKNQTQVIISFNGNRIKIVLDSTRVYRFQ